MTDAKKTMRGFAGILAFILLTGCGAAAGQKKETSAPEKLKYQFVDVLGNSYEAELLADVPKCTYDYDRLLQENGYRYYTDEKGKKSSKLGIDVSEYQGDIDWNQVKAAGIEFAVIRVGYRGYGSEGKLVEDGFFQKNMKGAKQAQIPVGVYFFSQAVSRKETLEEAEFVMQRIKEYDLAYPVVFDTEEIKEEGARTAGLDKRQFTENCVTFCDTFKNAGYDTMIYANMKWMAFTLDLKALKEYAKWYADYEEKPQCPYEFAMWQYTESGSVPGIDGNVDINVSFP